MAATTPGSSALELRGVCKRYGTGTGGQVTAADNVTFTIEAGTFTALTGASGSATAQSTTTSSSPATTQHKTSSGT